MSYSVETISAFDRELKRLSKKYASLASKGKGKSGGGRIISCVKVTAERVILLSIYDKSEQEDIEAHFLKQLLKENDLI